MKRLTILLVSLALPVWAIAQAHEQHAAHAEHAGHEMHHAAPQKTMTGEIVDTGCYLAHGGRGPKHARCAARCVRQGMPMGLRTNDGKLYLLTMNHDNPDPYNRLRQMAGRTVSVTGEFLSRDGMKGIDVSGFRSVAPARM